MFGLYTKKYPNVQVVNAALAGGTGAGGNMKAVLKTRMLGGDPPDSFQVHLGHELIDTWATTGYMETLDDLYKQEGYADVFPKDMIDIASWSGHQWSVPVNVMRANVLWYNKTILNKYQLEPPTTVADFLQTCETLKGKGVIPWALGESSPGQAAEDFESVLIGTLGAEGWDGLWTGKTPFTDSKVTDSLNTYLKYLSYANPDYLGIAWGDGTNMLIAGKTAMVIDGDWTDGNFKAKSFTDWGAVPAPGDAGIWDLLSDSFGLPKKAKDRDNALNWIKLCGSQEGQDTFDTLKGAIPPRSDAGKVDGYDDFQKQSMIDFQKFAHVPSVVHGAAVKESWTTDYDNDMNI
ncbi:MAG: ABC transporter substrate-binding protein, partial [Candidatus Dormibacteraceae bacterium]